MMKNILNVVINAFITLHNQFLETLKTYNALFNVYPTETVATTAAVQNALEALCY